jgi:pimeloyl-ACP methyl ester carboxylesterase
MPSDTAPVPSKRISLRGVDFAYSDSGTGPLVLNAHGLTSSRAHNGRAGFADFAIVSTAGYRVVSYDARGHGASAGTPDAELYSWSELAEDFLALADHFSPTAPVTGIGSSMGTGTVLHAVIRRPDRFDRLVLTAPPTAWETRAGQAGTYRLMADMVESSDPKTLLAMMSRAPVPTLFADVEGYPPPPDVAHELLPAVFRGAALSDLPPIAAIATLHHPALIIAWVDDPGHPVSTAEKLAQAMPNATLHVSNTFVDVQRWGELARAFLAR